MIPFVERRSLWFAIPLVIIALGLGAFFIRGFVLGIDFTGGTILERGLPKAVTAQEIREVLAGTGMDLSSAVVQPLGDGREVLIRAHALSSEEIKLLDDALRQAYGEVQVRRTELVGPTIGEELVGQSLIAVLLGCLGVLAYVSVRFQPSQGVAAIIALIHDVLVTVSVFLLLGKEVNGSFIAALLTIIGYSINNTIVVFDRVRENLKFSPDRRDLVRLVNESIYQTLGRTINTSITTLIAVLALFLFGGTTIKDFTLALLVGLVAGTYSSVFIAGPLWTAWRLQKDKDLAAA
ncbi:MAG: protein translocase subunit SecF [Firmicutes bacterium]|jgi:preprotein translocase subunit SecF|nr:protein translocase subunit SecF [Bacillota bacterium]